VILMLPVLMLILYHLAPVARLREATAPVLRFAALSVMLCGVVCVAVVGNPSLGG
jgi:hypothetical protein